GVTMTLLALLGASAHRLPRVFLLIALLGAALTLGPELHWKGATLPWPMPYRYVEEYVPGIHFSGVPVRFGYVLYFGVVGAAAFGLAASRVLLARCVAGDALVLVVVSLAVWEWRTPRIPVSECPVPPIVRAWATEPETWAVLDVSGGWREMWHATIHRKPIV